MPAFRILLLAVCLHLGLPAFNHAADVSAEKLENLQYRVSLGIWRQVAIVNLSLKQVGPDRFLAEFSGATQGLWTLINRWLPERYQTEMLYHQGRLKPLVYREEFVSKGKKVTKEIRFDYQQGVLELWRKVEGQEMVKKWQAPLTGTVYDPLSLFYNVRLGVFGPLPGGETLRLAAIPTPKPWDFIIHFGADTEQGRKVMLTFKEKGSGKDNPPYFLYCNPDGVPNLAWMTVLKFGKLSGTLLGGSVGKLALPPAPE